MDLTAIAACTVLLAVGTAVAQDRMPPIPQEQMTEAQKQVAEELIAGPRGALIGPFIPLLRSPGLMAGLQKAGEHLRYHSTLPANVRELIILFTARKWTQQFEWDAHMPLALKAGVKQEVVAAVSEGQRPNGMAENEEVAYNFCTELQENRSVSDATYARAVEKFGEQGAVDMAGLSGYYTTLAMIMNMARTPLPAGKKPQLPQFPNTQFPNK